jgi:membrane protein
VVARPRLDTVTDYGRRVFNGLAEDNAFFLAGGVAFSLLLALVPFVLLLVVGLSFALGRSPEQATTTVVALTESFLPRDAFEAAAVLRTIVDDVLRTRGAVGIGAGLGFVWTATRLFGSLRAVLAIVLDRDERSIVAGKLFDVGAAFVTTLLVVLWVVLSTYLTIAGDRGTTFLAGLGVRLDALGALSYWLGRALGFSLLCLTFYGLYRGLPRRRPSREAALIAALIAAALFELARHLYTLFVVQLSPSTLYTGTIAVIVSVVFWVYYGALLFLLGAEVAQAHELRRDELARLATVPDPKPATRGRRSS